MPKLTVLWLQGWDSTPSISHVRKTFWSGPNYQAKDSLNSTLPTPYQSSGLTASGSGIFGLSSQSSGFWSFGSSISRGGFTGGDISFSKFPLLTTVWSTSISKLLSGFKTVRKKDDVVFACTIQSMSHKASIIPTVQPKLPPTHQKLRAFLLTPKCN